MSGSIVDKPFAGHTPKQRTDFEVNSERLSLYSQLFLYGDFMPLDFYVDPVKCEAELNSFKDDWKVYQPQKGDTGRVGLSLTSLDGSLSGYPELQSLYEYTQETGHKVSENEFCQLTPVYEKVTAIRDLVDYFSPYVGRSRFVRFRAGGHFPPHRDQSANFQVPDYFRLFVALGNTGANRLFFIYDNQVVPYEVGRVYLFNALKVHSVFSMRDNAMTLAISLKLTQESVARAIKRLEVR